MQYGIADDGDRPVRARVRALLHSALPAGGEVTVRFVDWAEGESLNHRYRKRQSATNVLSFSYEKDNGILGDIVICYPLAQKEARLKKTCVQDYIAHLIVHGALHLDGYRHDNNNNTRLMENAERMILKRFGPDRPLSPSMSDTGKLDLRTWLSGLFNASPGDIDELLQQMRRLQKESGLFDNNAMCMIEGVLRMSKWQIRDVMLPKTILSALILAMTMTPFGVLFASGNIHAIRFLIKTASMSGAFFWLRTCCTTAIKDMISL